MKDEMDILKEVGTTAAAHGSIALSEILGRKISLRLPSLNILPRERITKEMHIEGMVLTLQMQILSGLEGKIVFLLEEKSAFRLIDMCYKSRGDNKKAGLFTEMGMSVIKEVGNIIISSYISSLNFFIKKLIIPSFPMLINAPFAEIMNALTLGYEKEDYILVVEAIFEEEKESIRGNFWLVLTPNAAEEIRRICKEMLESINKD